MNLALKTVPNGYLNNVCVNFFKRAAFLLTLFALTPMSSFADTTSITAILSVDYWVDEASVMDLTYDLSEYTLLDSQNLSLDVNRSWFVDPAENFTYQLSLDAAAEELHLVITKASGTSCGTGEVARVGGILIMDDIMAKQGGVTLFPTSISVTSPPTVSPNPIAKGDGWKFQVSTHLDRLELWNSNGQRLALDQEEISQLIDGELTPGVYFLRMTKDGQTFHRRLQIVQ